jgi:hypothetical protein
MKEKRLGISNEDVETNNSSEQQLGRPSSSNSNSNELPAIVFEAPVEDIPLQQQKIPSYCSSNSLPNGNKQHSTPPSIASIASTSSGAASVNPSSFRCDGYGFPLSIFTKVK